MLHILMRPILVPRIMMLRKCIHNTLSKQQQHNVISASSYRQRSYGRKMKAHPDHDHPTIKPLLTLPPALEPGGTEEEHDDHDGCVADLNAIDITSGRLALLECGIVDKKEGAYEC